MPKNWRKSLLYTLIIAKPLIIMAVAIWYPNSSQGQRPNANVGMKVERYLFLNEGSKVMFQLQGQIQKVLFKAKKFDLLKHPSINGNLKQTTQLFENCIKSLEELRLGLAEKGNWNQGVSRFSKQLSSLIEVQKLVDLQVQTHIYAKGHQI